MYVCAIALFSPPKTLVPCSHLLLLILSMKYINYVSWIGFIGRWNDLKVNKWARSLSSLCLSYYWKIHSLSLQIPIPSGGRNIFLGWKSYTPPVEFGFCFFEITVSPQVEQLAERKIFCQQVPLLYTLLHLTRDGKKQEIIVGLFTKCHPWDSKFGWRPRAKKTQEPKES